LSYGHAFTGIEPASSSERRSRTGSSQPYGGCRAPCPARREVGSSLPVTMSRDGRIRTCVLLLPKQAGWPDSPTSRGAPGEIQTPDLLVRSQALSFTELRGRERAKSFRSHVPQLQLPPSRRPLRPGGDFSSRSVRWPPVASREVPGPARIAPLCGSSQAAPGFPECPEEDSNPSPQPGGRVVRRAMKKGGPPGRPQLERSMSSLRRLRQCDLGCRVEGSVCRHASPKA
jgi:hypothetical protein